MRSRPSLMPAAARASGEMRPCVVEAGWVMVVLVSPRLAVMGQQLAVIDDLPGLLASALHFEGNDGPAGFLLGLGQLVLRV